MQRTSIHPTIVQPFLDSATNAAQKGQAQFYTPLEFGRLAAMPLHLHRPVVTDLNCGNGSLLMAAVNSTTTHLQGIDIDPVAFGRTSAPRVTDPDNLFVSRRRVIANDITRTKIAGDLQLVAPMLAEVEYQGLCFVLNPPWDLHWHRRNFAWLADAEMDAVNAAFKGRDPRLGRDEIDSTVATLMAALALGHRTSEGVLICNASTFERLVRKPDAPHHALAEHCWGIIEVEGNPMTGDKGHAFGGEFHTALVYFANSHHGGLKQSACVRVQTEDLERVALQMKNSRLQFRQGAELSEWADGDVIRRSPLKFHAVSEEWKARAAAATKPHWNIWLNVAGEVATNLSIFQQHSVKVDKAAAQRLHGLAGRTPMQLVLQRNDRRALEEAALGNLWTVQPALREAVEAAIRDYHAARAPLTPLPKIQRLGYLDEEDSILCEKTLRAKGFACESSFTAGQRYKLTSKTLGVQRNKMKPNASGDYEEVQYDGQQLAFYITDDQGVPRVFMDAPLRAKGIKVGERAKVRRSTEIEKEVEIDYTTHQLVDHFQIPEVPDVAAFHPEAYQLMLDRLDQMAALMTKKPKAFQREDLARAACLHDGAVLAWDTGLGKTFAEFIYPMLKLGFTTGITNPMPGERVRPKGRVLLTVPGDLHDQTIAKAWEIFGVVVRRIDSQDSFLRLSANNQRRLPDGFYITSFTELTGNGVQDFPGHIPGTDPWPLLAQLGLPPTAVAQWFAERGPRWIADWDCFSLTPERATENDLRRAYLRAQTGESTGDALKEMDAAYRRLLNYVCDKANPRFDQLPVEKQWGVAGHFLDVKLAEYRERICMKKPESESGPACVYSPTLVELCGDAFDCAVIDEAVKMKGAETAVGMGVRSLRPRYRLAMTGTPIKNRLPDIFYLIWWACGAHPAATARWPFAPTDQEAFATEFLVSERNLTKEEETKRRYKKLTAEVCQIHRLWKLMGPNLLRRRKDACGVEIVGRDCHIVRVPMGAEQARIYAHYLDTSPNGAVFLDKNMKNATGARLQALRQAAADPSTPLLTQGRSLQPWTPKLMSALSLIEQCVSKGEQVLVGAAFNAILDRVSERLDEAGVKHLHLDGRVNPRRRGELSAQFALGPAGGIPVTLGGVDSVAAGHNWPLCPTVILVAYSWAFDTIKQFLDRIHRMDSPRRVKVYVVITEGTIDLRLWQLQEEKKDSCELVLDGALLGEQVEEVSLWQLLQDARREFKAGVKTVDETTLRDEWPEMRDRLRRAMRTFGGNATLPASPEISPPASPLFANETEGSGLLLPLQPEISPVPVPAAVVEDWWKSRPSVQPTWRNRLNSRWARRPAV